LSVIEYAQQLYDSDFASGIRESLFVFPIIEGIHLLSLAFSVGLLMLVDLRLVGLYLRDVPVSEVLGPMRPWLLTGFMVQLISGVLLFASEAANVVEMVVFWIKILVIVLAGINMLWFELTWGRRITDWDTLPSPAGVRIAGWLSLSFWTIAVICGRLIPYLQAGSRV
jgi:uncharacterized protein DUF6644